MRLKKKIIVCKEIYIAAFRQFTKPTRNEFDYSIDKIMKSIRFVAFPICNLISDHNYSGDLRVRVGHYCSSKLLIIWNENSPVANFVLNKKYKTNLWCRIKVPSIEQYESIY